MSCGHVSNQSKVVDGVKVAEDQFFLWGLAGFRLKCSVSGKYEKVLWGWLEPPIGENLSGLWCV